MEGLGLIQHLGGVQDTGQVPAQFGTMVQIMESGLGPHTKYDASCNSSSRKKSYLGGRIGEASNPGPQHTLGQYFSQIKGLNIQQANDMGLDCVVTWATDNGMSFRNYPRDGHALFAAMGHFFGMNQLDSRQVIAEAAKTHWARVCPEDINCARLPPFVKAALGEGEGWERELIMVFASEMECQIHLMCPGEDTQVFGQGQRTTRILRFPSGQQGGHPDHYLPVWPRHQGDEGEIPTLGVRSTHGIRVGNQTRARPGEKTEVMTVNVSGSKEQLRAVLGMKVDIVLVQEHWG